MLHSIRTGETAFARVHGIERFEYMKVDAEFAATFNRAMTEGSVRLASEIVTAYDFSGFATIVDVGGGQGWLLSEILRTAPAARGVLVVLQGPTRFWLKRATCSSSNETRRTEGGRLRR